MIAAAMLNSTPLLRERWTAFRQARFVAVPLLAGVALGLLGAAAIGAGLRLLRVPLSGGHEAAGRAILVLGGGFLGLMESLQRLRRVLRSRRAPPPLGVARALPPRRLR